MGIALARVNFGFGIIGWIILLGFAAVAGLLAMLTVGFRDWRLALSPLVGIGGGLIGMFIFGFFFSGSLGLIGSVLLVFIGPFLVALPFIGIARKQRAASQLPYYPANPNYYQAGYQPQPPPYSPPQYPPYPPQSPPPPSAPPTR